MNGVLGNADMISEDGVHPNAAGARYIAGTIWEYLEPMAKKLEKETVEPTRLDTR
jgi:lysophospholipase L1-like esterase